MTKNKNKIDLDLLNNFIGIIYEILLSLIEFEILRINVELWIHNDNTNIENVGDCS